MSPERVVVLVDYENMHRCAQNELGVSNGHLWPWALGERLVDRRNLRSGFRTCELREVRVYRGLPDARLQPQANAAKDEGPHRCPRRPRDLPRRRRRLAKPRAGEQVFFVRMNNSTRALPEGAVEAYRSEHWPNRDSS